MAVFLDAHRQRFLNSGSSSINWGDLLLSRKFTFIGSIVGTVDPLGEGEKLYELQVLSGSNYRNAYLDEERKLELDSVLQEGGNVTAFFVSYEAQSISLKTWKCEITQIGLTPLVGNSTAPFIKNPNQTDFIRVNSAPVIRPRTQSFGRPQGLSYTSGITELSNGNDFSITICGTNNDLSFLNIGFVNEYNSSNVLTNDCIKVCLDSTTNKIGAIIKADGTTYSLNFIDQIIGDNSLHAVTLTINGTTKEAKLYLDGIFQDSLTFSGTYNNTGVQIFSRGGNSSGGYTYENWRGFYKELNVSEKVLSDEEVLWMHNNLLT